MFNELDQAIEKILIDPSAPQRLKTAGVNFVTQPICVDVPRVVTAWPTSTPLILE
jgi:hypothetical protein